MQFRPCIDIHNGSVKQIVGSSLTDQENAPKENFVSKKDASYYANLYKEHGLTGGHIILLNKEGTPEYEATKAAAVSALAAFPGGMQIGGGINDKNAASYIEAGASHVIVTSYVFSQGRINYENLRKMHEAVGKEHLVLDLSCQYCEASENGPAGYYIVTDRWQNVTKERVSEPLLDELAFYCSEFLIHAVDVEGKNSGIERKLVELLCEWNQLPITYAGGIHDIKDIEEIRTLGKGLMNFTVGSALDLFGGQLKFEDICKMSERE